jgi:hypothetical protein
LEYNSAKGVFMPPLTRIPFALLFAGAILGQNGVPVTPRPFAGVVHPVPTGSRSLAPSVNRFAPPPAAPVAPHTPAAPSAVNPGPHHGAPPAASNVILMPYVVPVYVGSNLEAPPAEPAAQAADPSIVYQSSPAPVIVPQYGDAAPSLYVSDQNSAYIDPNNPEAVSIDRPEADTAADRYLIALKDHTVYSVVAYWVNDDTLHYFTAGNVHNQVSLSLVDRSLTTRLNKVAGLEVKFPSDN